VDKISLIMVLHGHQPVGNYDKVFALATRVCYRPVVELLGQYPDFHFGLHFSGPLLGWLEQNDPELLDLLAAMVGRGQVEMLSGGYYEPLLSSIPARDALGQLAMMTDYLQRRFGQRPQGFWLAERVWEPGLPAKLAPAGLGYTLVDDTHLYYAGLPPRAMFGHSLTEREGHLLALLPTNKELRYTIPFQEPQATLDFMRRALDEHGPTCATYGDDCEKFGLWPRTQELVFGRGWLRRFVEAVLANGDWLATCRPGQWVAENKPAGRVYPPTASYEEMGEWSLPVEAGQALARAVEELRADGRYEGFRRFIRGGVWDNFLVKYRPSNIMHKRMLRISQKVAQTGDPVARDHLYQAQCNCAYWHGMFGGLYLGHLRQAVHQQLIAAEAICDAASAPAKNWAAREVADIDLDGAPEVALANRHLDLLIHPAHGGSASVLNLRGPACNLADVLTRQPEAYHRHLWEPHDDQGQGGDEVKSIHDVVRFKQPDLPQRVVYDWYQRACFQDHLLAPKADWQSYQRPDYGEWGDLIDQPFELVEHGQDGGRAFCLLRRVSAVFAPGGPFPLSVEKRYGLGPGPELRLSYWLRAAADAPAMRLAVELNLTMLAHDDPQRFIELADGRSWSPGQTAQATGVEWLRLVNKPQDYAVTITPSPAAEAWLFPVETVSQSEDGLELTYQGSSLSFLWPAPAGAGLCKFELTLKIA